MLIALIGTLLKFKVSCMCVFFCGGSAYVMLPTVSHCPSIGNNITTESTIDCYYGTAFLYCSLKLDIFRHAQLIFCPTCVVFCFYASYRIKIDAAVLWIIVVFATYKLNNLLRSLINGERNNHMQLHCLETHLTAHDRGSAIFDYVIEW